MNAAFSRLALITGEPFLDRLTRTRALVVGLGGVGSWCAEALVRSGIGAIDICDSDIVCVTNINRQAQATARNIGRLKTDALAERLLDINPKCNVSKITDVYSAATRHKFDFSLYAYLIDAIDSLSCKLDLIEGAFAAEKKLFSCMGMAQKMDPTQIKTASIWRTEGCPLARLVREGLRKRGFTGDFTAVYSPERLPICGEAAVYCGTGHCVCPKAGRPGPDWCASKKVINGSAVTVTASAGMILASLVLRDIATKKGEE
jgi:tRNA A37 threonylcarbamoyladenosine dehydratase